MNAPILRPARVLAGLALAAIAGSAAAAPVQLTVHVQNLAPASSISFAPLHVGIHNGSFDAFDNGQTAGTAIVSVAEGGAGGAWQAAFAAAEPQATRGTVGGLLQPGATASATFVVDPTQNRFFTFAAMVVPSNDFFIGNDSPTRFQILDAAGNLLIHSIDQAASQVWDAGSETFDPAAAAFVGNNDLRTPQNGVVSFNFAELAGFDGLTTATGYVFESRLARDTGVYRITFEATSVPEPAPLALAALGIVAAVGTRRRRTAPRL